MTMVWFVLNVLFTLLDLFVWDSPKMAVGNAFVAGMLLCVLWVQWIERDQE